MVLDLFFSLITDFIFISLFKNGELVNKIYENNACLHSENFISKLGNFLKNEGFSLKEINNIFFLSGPGGQTGERVSFSFATSMKILNPVVKIFSLSSLNFQTGLNSNCLSVISVGENTKKYYVDVYEEGRIILKKEKIEKNELDKIIESFNNFYLIFNFNNVDFSVLFLNTRFKFSQFSEVY
ncbi:MAG: hypothetical protein AM1032_000071 [Mycoplasmataceae bacterium]|nr:MAG: hypothetical protein AM1032_000071 [Mycoplasmataceae bacterium]